MAVEDVPVASVRIFEDRVKVAWGEDAEQLSANGEAAGLNAGLSWVAARAAEIGEPIRARVFWLVSWLVEVEPSGRYRKLDGPRLNRFGPCVNLNPDQGTRGCEPGLSSVWGKT